MNTQRKVVPIKKNQRAYTEESEKLFQEKNQAATKIIQDFSSLDNSYNNLFLSDIREDPESDVQTPTLIRDRDHREEEFLRDFSNVFN